MFGVSQRLLGLLLLFMVVWTFPAGAWKRLISLEKAPDGTHLYLPMSATREKGRFYVVDTGNKRLVSYDAQGNPLKALNPGGKLVAPLDLDFGPKGNLWIVDRGLNAILRVNFAAREIKIFHLLHNGRELFPERLCWVEEILYVLDRETGGVAEIELQSERIMVKRIWIPQKRPFYGFLDFKVKSDGLWGLERNSYRIHHLSWKGKETVWELQGPMVYPISIEVIGSKLLVLDRYLRKIFVYELKDPPSLVYQFLEWGWGRGRLYLPRELEFVDGLLLVVDEGNGRVEVLQRGR